MRLFLKPLKCPRWIQSPYQGICLAPYRCRLVACLCGEARGLNGTVAAADCVQVCANFGLHGIIVPAIAIRIILVTLNAIFADPAIRISLNAIPLALSF